MTQPLAQPAGERSANAAIVPDSASAPVSTRDALRQRLDSFRHQPEERPGDSDPNQSADDQPAGNEGNPPGDNSQDSAGDASEERPGEDPDGEDGNLPAPTALSLDDTAVYQVGDETVTGAELQERLMLKADHTRKTQELSDRRKEMEAEREQYAQNLAFLESANNASLQQYQQLDWQQLGSNPAEYQRKQQELQQLLQRKQQIDGAKQQFFEHLKQQRLAQRNKAAQDAVETLKTVFPDWGNERYSALRETAQAYDIPVAEFDEYTDPRIMRILHDAGQYRQAQQQAREAVKRKPKPQPKGQNRDTRLSTEQAKRMNLTKQANAGDTSANRALLKDRLGKRFGRT